MRSTNISDPIPISVLGAGAWGTALAILLARNGGRTILWSWEADHARALREARCNKRFLPNHPFPPLLSITANLTDALSSTRDILIAVPSYAFREVLESASPMLTTTRRISWATKGFESGTGRLLHHVVADIMGPDTPMAVLSGPTFAAEVAAGLPTAITLASTDDSFAQELSMSLHTQRFRVYTSGDIIGVQIGGGVKNILAIAAGAADGLGFGANARAGLITRGLTELIRLGVALGGKRETFMGFAGLGDLILTCTDDQSRNRRLGLALAGGKSLDDAKCDIGQVIEGIDATRVVVDLARRHGIEMPIAEQVYKVLFEQAPPLDAVNALLARSARPETL
uniref:Glycerol-3-phosphate dehydrogenase [NAD(P)+] n=1 Tax=Candidatus Kentrum sp. TC TaxID=2126339 RepID=A0A450YKV4_9GAMM|nr:MAG: glycerol-3-phosphate dehydrogenase (NAD(P)+) [Candidatus Kentron sp. TC]VFK42704.1 MAG: glycerol-3-phosphate dehydrogenase (NAD(P)+) [Candidatus Kentron sp. TC]VFK58751.1 MAG: glycerol-3-phosphate dehydrogenase (NAD(P)+) [Candidatus Kentron sp. TC]